MEVTGIKKNLVSNEEFRTQKYTKYASDGRQIQGAEPPVQQGTPVEGERDGTFLVSLQIPTMPPTQRTRAPWNRNPKPKKKNKRDHGKRSYFEPDVTQKA